MSETVDAILRYKGHHTWVVRPDDSVFEAVRLMADKGAGALVVAVDGRVAGVISERDCARKVMLEGKAARDTRVEDIMTAPAVSVAPDHTVDECLRLMTDKRIRHLPVLQNDRLVGVVSIGDLVRHVISRQSETIQFLEQYIEGRPAS
jgi:CBS domain-containing protein